MGMLSNVIDFARDTKRIAAKKAGPGAGRASILSGFLRLKAKRLMNGEDKTAWVLDYRVDYLDLENLEYLYREIFIARAYEMSFDTPNPVIIDCGSNIGMSILFFKNLFPGARITGFEPHPLVFAVLNRNIEQNGLENATVHQKALSDTAGSLDFYINQDDPGSLNMGLYARGDNVKHIAVDTELLSDHITGTVDLLKLDIEGAEESVVRDLFNSGKLANVRRMICEYHHHIDENVDGLSRMLSMLEAAGFGYQISAYCEHPVALGKYQDIMIYAYQEGTVEHVDS